MNLRYSMNYSISTLMISLWPMTGLEVLASLVMLISHSLTSPELTALSSLSSEMDSLLLTSDGLAVVNPSKF
jgi:hypothetical protein